MNRNKGRKLSIFGIIVAIVGVIALYNGNKQNEDYERRIYDFFSSGKTDAPGNSLCYLGYALIAVGTIMVIAGIIYYISAKSNDEKRGLSGNYCTPDEKLIIELLNNGDCRWIQKIENNRKVKIKGRFNRVGDNSWLINLEGWDSSVKLDMVDSKLYVSTGKFKSELNSYNK